MSTSQHIARDIRDGIFPQKSPRWYLIEKEFCFYVACERDGLHIRIVYGDNGSNRPLYGSKDEACADAETIIKALNERDCPIAHVSTPQGSGK